MEYKTPYFTTDMIKDYTILLPNMAVTQFSLVKAVFQSEGYHVEILSNSGREVAQRGLKYVNNDTCYPALVVIGQFINALDSGKYDLKHTALAITQTGGGCRASNYLKLLRKALVRAGYGYIPVASINFSSLEKESSLHFSLRFGMKSVAAVFYGDLLAALRNQISPYEIHAGDADAKVKKWQDIYAQWMIDNHNYYIPVIKKNCRKIIADFASIPVKKTKKVKVGIVGEIYVKFSPLGNNNLQNFLESQDCEVNVPGLLGFAEYCIANQFIDVDLYGGSRRNRHLASMAISLLDNISGSIEKEMKKYGYFWPGPFREMLDKPKGIVSIGVKMGEGWLLPAEMIELIQNGYSNIVCAQPFGCLPNHIVGKGVISKIRSLYPESNITPIDYDASATKVNQENRIKLMLAIARERLNTDDSADTGSAS